MMEPARYSQQNLGGCWTGAETEAQREVRKDGRDGERRDDRGLAAPGTRPRLLDPQRDLRIVSNVMFIGNADRTRTDLSDSTIEHGRKPQIH